MIARSSITKASRPHAGAGVPQWRQSKQPSQHFFDPKCDFSQKGTVVYGSYIDEPLALITPSAKYYYHANHLYSVAALTDSTGAVKERYRYDTYGQRTVLAPDGVTPRAVSSYNQQVGFTGRYLDRETGLWYFRARYYSGSLGRFIGRDPMGYVDGYQMYMAYFAVNGLDPSGLIDGFWGKAWDMMKSSALKINCEILKQSIRNHDKEIKDRIGELNRNGNDPQNPLPWSAPGDDKKPSLSQRGHVKLLNMHKALRDGLKGLYDRWCRGPCYDGEELEWEKDPILIPRRPPGINRLKDFIDPLSPYVPQPVPMPEPLDPRCFPGGGPIPPGYPINPKWPGVTPPISIPIPGFPDIPEEVGWGAGAYIIISEGSRLFPPRNLIPVP